jgi:membrane protein required for colicin V production
VDRLCGAVFGILKGTLIVAVLLIALTAFLQRGTPLIRDSLLAPQVMHLSRAMARVVPQTMKSQFLEGIEALDKAWK